MFEESYKIRISARAIVIHEDKILLNNFGNGSYYNFPGGGIEKGETALLAVIREVQEETGLNVNSQELVFILEYEPFSANYLYGDGHHISLFFRCEVVGNTTIQTPSIPDVNPDDSSLVSYPEWVQIAKLPSLNILPHINENLIKYFETGTFIPKFFEEPYTK